MSTADHESELPAARSRGSAEAEPRIPGFFAARWAGAAPAGTIFFRDMLVVGTGINLAMTFVALMALGFKAPTWVAMAIFFSPVPYNLFLVTALWRSTVPPEFRHAGAFRAAGLLWLVIVTLI